jgi:VanZ family protein
VVVALARGHERHGAAMTERPTFALGAMAAAALATYGSLVPFRWRVAPDPPWARLSAPPLAPLAVTWSGDLVVNVAVMLPVGFFALAALSYGRRVDRLTVVSVGAALAAFALALEIAQLFVRDRTASWSDVAGLTAGGVAGITLWTVAGERLVKHARCIRDGSLSRRLYALTLLYTSGWVAVSLLPLLFPKYAYPLVRSVWLRTPPPLTTWTTAAEWALDAVSVAPIGAAIMLGTVRSRLRAPAAAALALVGILVVVAADSIEQIAPLMGRASVWARLLGLIFGAAAGSWLTRHGLSRTTAWLSFAGWLALVVLVTWAPFDFGVAPEQLYQRIRILYERAPLSRYYWAPPLLALDLAAAMLLLALTAGVLLDVATGARRHAAKASIVIGVTIAFAVIEWGQLYLPARRADPTDVGLALIGALTGVRLSSWLAASPPRPRADS